MVMAQSIPCFAGCDPELWLDSIEGYFYDLQIPTSQWVTMASRYLEGVADSWARKNTHLTDWCAFSYHLLWEFESAKDESIVDDKDDHILEASVSNSEESLKVMMADEDSVLIDSALGYDFVDIDSSISELITIQIADKLFDEIPSRELRYCCEKEESIVDTEENKDDEFVVGLEPVSRKEIYESKYMVDQGNGSTKVQIVESQISTETPEFALDFRGRADTIEAETKAAVEESTECPVEYSVSNSQVRCL